MCTIFKVELVLWLRTMFPFLYKTTGTHINRMLHVSSVAQLLGNAQVTLTRVHTFQMLKMFFFFFFLWLFLVDGDGKQYDAYIAYPRVLEGSSEKAEIFAMSTLPQVLEGLYGYKLFILGRDGLPGEGKALTTK